MQSCRVPKLLRYLLLFSICCNLTTATAWAHKVHLFAYVEGGTVFTESYFPDGKKVGGGKITVLDAQGRGIVEGTTDSQGLFSFPLGKKEDLTIVLDASMGHRVTFVLNKQEM